MTEDLRVECYSKRLLIIDWSFGNSEHHLQRLTAPAAQ
jgi:hypothetical protein